MATARNALRDLMTNPGSYSGSPGYGFALRQGEEAARRAAAASGQRGSGNALAALTRYASGLASQGYGDEVQRRLQAAALEQQGELATNAQGIDRDRLALEGELGRGRLGLDRDRFGLEGELGRGGLELGRGRLGLDATRASYDYDLGSRGLDDAREGRWWDYDLGRRRTDLEGAEMENRFNLGRDASARGWYDSRTSRGQARNQFTLGQRSADNQADSNSVAAQGNQLASRDRGAQREVDWYRAHTDRMSRVPQEDPADAVRRRMRGY